MNASAMCSRRSSATAVGVTDMPARSQNDEKKEAMFFHRSVKDVKLVQYLDVSTHENWEVSFVVDF